MDASYKFFENKNCQYFPCHKIEGTGGFNCLFCYCPLYFLGDKCGGSFGKIGRIKDCSNCIFPHVPGNYELIVRKVAENIEQFS